VLAVPTVDLAETVVNIGNYSDDALEKFAHFGLMPTPAQTVDVPLVRLRGRQESDRRGFIGEALAASPLARRPRNHFAAPVDESPHGRGKVPAVWVKNGNRLRYGLRCLQHADQPARGQVLTHHVTGNAD